MRLLLVSYDFPPVGGTGVLRAVKFARYLPQHGIEPIVLTNAHALGRSYDESIAARNELKNVEVVRLGGEILRSLHRHKNSDGAFPWHATPALAWSTYRYSDVFGLWYQSIRGKLDALAKHHRIDAVLTTIPHPSTGLIGLHLSQSLSLPWVLDVRDSMVGNAERAQLSAVGLIQQYRLKRMERRFMKGANRVLAVSQPIIDRMLARVSDTDPSKFVLLPNGFDPTDFPPKKVRPPNHKLRLIYAGTLDPPRTPEVLVSAINRAIYLGLLDPVRLRLDFYGKYPESATAAIARIDPRIERYLHGFVPQHLVIAASAAADVAVILTVPSSDPSSQEVMTGKIFECMGQGQYVLALTDAEPLRNLIHRSRLGDVTAAGDVGAVAAVLGALYARWQRDGVILAAPDLNVIREYDRRHQASLLADRLRELQPNQVGH